MLINFYKYKKGETKAGTVEKYNDDHYFCL